MYECVGELRVRIYDRAYVCAYICTCTCIRVSLHLFTRINANTVSYVRMHEFAYVSSCGFN